MCAGIFPLAMYTFPYVCVLPLCVCMLTTSVIVYIACTLAPIHNHGTYTCNHFNFSAEGKSHTLAYVNAMLIKKGDMHV